MFVLCDKYTLYPLWNDLHTANIATIYKRFPNQVLPQIKWRIRASTTTILKEVATSRQGGNAALPEVH